MRGIRSMLTSMRVGVTALVFISCFSGSSGTDSDRRIEIPAGSLTNAEAIALTEHADEGLLNGLEPGLRAFTKSTNAIFDAGTFYARVSDTLPMQENETLRILDEHVLYGEALACRNSSCRVVFIRPVAQIAHHWLKIMQQAFVELEQVTSSTAAHNEQSIKFMSELKASDEAPDSIWSHLCSLYCVLQPDGNYTNLDRIVKFCRANETKLHQP
jgi:hypothetical protein